MRTRICLSVLALAGSTALVGQMKVNAGSTCIGADCGDGTGPDVIVGDLSGISKWGTVGAVTGYSIGTTSCNIGTENLLWVAQSTNHPVIAQNMYRLKDGRFEQIGMGWLKHGFTALTGNLCGCGCNGQGGTVLGVGCSDPYGSSLNGDQNGFVCGSNTCGGLGPRSEVNPSKGTFEYPYGLNGQSGNAIFKRIQIDNNDVDPTLNPGASYYAEGHYISPDDADAGNHHNNASYESVSVGSFSGGGWNLSVTGATSRGCPAIYAWQDDDPMVTIEVVEDASGGRFHVGYRVTDNGDGTSHYEYAVHNLNSDRAGREFSVPYTAGTTISNLYFHDIDYHSGDGAVIGTNYDGTDWATSTGPSSVSWFTSAESVDDNANALRWGTLYNFAFDANATPEAATATIGLYRSGTPASLSVNVLAPGATPPCPWDCDGSLDGVVGVADLLQLLAEYDVTSPSNCAGGGCDFDSNGCVDVADLLKLLGHYDPAGVGCP